MDNSKGLKDTAYLDDGRYHIDDSVVSKDEQQNFLRQELARQLQKYDLLGDVENLENTGNEELKRSLTELLTLQEEWLRQYCGADIIAYDPSRIVLLRGDKYWKLLEKIEGSGHGKAFAFYIPGMDITILNGDFPLDDLQSHIAHENGHRITHKRLGVDSQSSNFFLQVGFKLNTSRETNDTRVQTEHFTIIDESLIELVKIVTLFEVSKKKRSEGNAQISHFFYDGVIVLFDALLEKLGYFEDDERKMKALVKGELMADPTKLHMLYQDLLGTGAEKSDIDFLFSAKMNDIVFESSPDQRLTIEQLAEKFGLETEAINEKISNLRSGKPISFFAGRVVVEKTTQPYEEPSQADRDKGMVFTMD